MRAKIAAKASWVRDWWNRVAFPVAEHTGIANASGWTAREVGWGWFWLVVAASAVLLPNLSYPLIDPDETRYTQIAIEMHETGDWTTPRLDGQPYLDKPPLLYWLTATSLCWLGNYETAVRLPSVISALATILIVFGFGSRLIGHRGAWCGAMTLALSGGFIMAGRFLILDSLLTLMTTTALLSGYLAVRREKHRWALWMVSGVACALGVLTKGPVALILCCPPLVAIGWLRPDEIRIRLIHWAAFVFPMLAVCIPWYFAVWQANAEFGREFFWEHNVRRFTQGSNHAESFWFYIPVLFAGMFPASMLLPSLAIFLVSRKKRKASYRCKDLGFLALTSIWILAFFSIASCKLPTYILPAIPIIALSLGAMIDHTVLKPELPSRIARFLLPFPQRSALIFVFATLIMVGIDAWTRRSFDNVLIAAIVGCVVCAVAAIWFWNREIALDSRGWIAIAAIGIAMLSFGSGRFMPTIATARSVHLITSRLAKQNPGAAIVYFGENAHAAKFEFPWKNYAVFRRHELKSFRSFVHRHPVSIVVTADDDIEATRRLIGESRELVETGKHKHIYLAKPIDDSNTRFASAAETMGR